MQRGRAFACFQCGASTDSGVISTICGCGLAAGPRLYPFTCAPNPAPSRLNPALS
jgi:hypothetical protein